MERRLVVSTQCPTCAAPLDFNEGSTAVSCAYCRSNLLVTGRKQVLSYYIDPKIEPRDAARRVWLACRDRGAGGRVTRWERYFVPYYRFVGHDLRWEKTHPEPEVEEANTGEPQAGASATAFGVRWGPTSPSRSSLQNLGEEGVGAMLCDRYVDKNFLACDLSGAGAYSVGVKLSVLKLRLYDPEVLRGLGHVVAPTMSVDAALAQGMATVPVAGGILQRRVLGRTLSLIYYPLCVVEIERAEGNALGIVDGNSGSVLEIDAPPSLYGTLRRHPQTEAQSLDFRPLACPNCGWDLPLEPENVVFFCTSCDHAWEIVGSDLDAVPHRIADASLAGSSPTCAQVEFLPFWVLQGRRMRGGPAWFYIPAFRYRRLKILVDLARDLSAEERAYNIRQGKALTLHGCYYDAEDAVSLAEIAYPEASLFRERTIRKSADAPPSFSTSSLTWFPFRVEAGALRAPFTGRAISRQLLT